MIALGQIAKMRASWAWGLAACLAGMLWSSEVALSQESPLNSAPRRPFSVPIKVIRYSQYLVDEHDQDNDGTLSQDEWDQLAIDASAVDADRDGLITASELSQWIAKYGRRRRIRLMPALSDNRGRLPPLLNPETRSQGPPIGDGSGEGQPEDRPLPQSTGAAEKPRPRRDLRYTVSKSRVPRGLPPSFLALDKDGDVQLSLAEFAPEPTRSDLAQFARYDANGDGIITPQEFLRAPRRPQEQEGVEEDMGEDQQTAAEGETSEDQTEEQESSIVEEDIESEPALVRPRPGKKKPGTTRKSSRKASSVTP